VADSFLKADEDDAGDGSRDQASVASRQPPCFEDDLVLDLEVGGLSAIFGERFNDSTTEHIGNPEAHRMLRSATGANHRASASSPNIPLICLEKPALAPAATGPCACFDRRLDPSRTSQPETKSPVPPRFRTYKLGNKS
jgi:hypothetical protein